MTKTSCWSHYKNYKRKLSKWKSTSYAKQRRKDRKIRRPGLISYKLSCEKKWWFKITKIKATKREKKMKMTKTMMMSQNL